MQPNARRIIGKYNRLLGIDWTILRVENRANDGVVNSSIAKAVHFYNRISVNLRETWRKTSSAVEIRYRTIKTLPVSVLAAL